MSEKDGKTEKPTPKKLSDARKKGQTPKSQDLTAAVSFGTFIMIASFLGTYTLKNGFLFLRKSLSEDFNVIGLENNLSDLGMKAILFFLVLAGPFLAIGFVTGLVGSVMQTGLMFSAEPIKFSLNKINPISGFKNIFSKKTLFTLLKNVSKLALVFYVAYLTITKSGYYVINSGNVGTEKLFFVLMELTRDLGIKLSLLLLVLGIVDYGYQRYDHKKNLMMSKQEIKDEYKQMEGDPQLKAQRRQRYKQLTKQMMSDIDSATVVLTNPTHLAIAIRYDKEVDEVPVIVAKGADHLAAKIRERAKDSGVPIIENKPVARAMYKSIEVGQPIPVDMYQTIAEILALVYQMEEANRHKI